MEVHIVDRGAMYSFVKPEFYRIFLSGLMGGQTAHPRMRPCAHTRSQQNQEVLSREASL